MRSPLPLALVLTVAALPMVGTSAWLDDFSQLSSGVSALDISGTAGSVAILGRNAFPFAQSIQRQVVVGCGYTDDDPNAGRVVALAHTSLANAATPEMRRWLLNLAAWSAHKQQPDLLLLGAAKKEWLDAGVHVIDAPKPWNPSILAKVQSVFINLHSLPPELATEVGSDLARFARAGGGIIVSSTPWAAKPEMLEFAAKLIQPAGLAFLPSGANDARYPLSAPSPYASALRAADALADEQAGSLVLSLAERQTAAGALEGCLAADLVSASLEKQLQTMHEHLGWSRFTADEPLRRNLKPVEALMARFESWWLKRQPPEKTPAHPLAADYPGPTAPGLVQSKTITFDARTGANKFVNHGERTRIPTGLYAPAGAPIRLSIPQAAIAAGWKVEIGIHIDKTWHLATWRRFPEISTSAELTQTETLVANSFGGLINLILPANCDIETVQVKIDGAVEAPVYTLGKTSAIEWKQHREAPGAWGYLETPRWTGYFPRNQLVVMEDPQKIAGYWQQVVELSDQFLGFGSWRKRGEAMLTDRDISVGYGHAGYPVMMAYGAEKKDGPTALGERALLQGDWGFLHELGHTFQDSFKNNYTIATHAEVDVNLVPALILNKIHGRTCWDNDAHPTFNAKTRIADLETWNQLPPSEQTWSKACKMNVAYDFYFTLAECFGWELYEKAFGRWMQWLQHPGTDASLDALPRDSPAAKRDRFFVLFSEESGYNLLPYFEKYGLGRGEFGLDEAARAQVAGLRSWSGNRPIDSMTGPASVTLSENALLPSALGKFTAHDPDPGTVFTYRITEGNADGAFAIEPRTGALSRVKAGMRGERTLVVEAQDNCIPLSTAKVECRAVIE